MWNFLVSVFLLSITTLPHPKYSLSSDSTPSECVFCVTLNSNLIVFNFVNLFLGFNIEQLNPPSPSVKPVTCQGSNLLLIIALVKCMLSY